MTSDRPVALILGAGINGAAIARELVLQGLDVTIVERTDLCYGATAYSSRLIHGGLRYLEYSEFDLVRESLAERRRLLRTAPQFVRPLELFIPVDNRFGGLWKSAANFLHLPVFARAAKKARGLWMVRMGLWMYDRYARDPSLPKHRVWRRHDELTTDIPQVGPQFGWLCSYYDAQIRYPERFVVAMLEDARQAAAAQGSTFELITYHEASLDGGEVTIRPTGGGEPAQRLRPAIIINATGAWVDETLQRLHVEHRRMMGGTKGSHLITFQPRLREALAGEAIYAEAADSRPFFILPFGQATLIGTTDLRYEGDPGQAVATREEIDYLLENTNRILPEAQLTANDVALHYSGVRPLPYVPAGSTGSITRRHWLEEHPGAAVPLYSVIGGKLTTCGSLARETAATVLARLDLPNVAQTEERLYPGAECYPDDAVGVDREQARLAEVLRAPRDTIDAVWELYGTRTETLFADILRDASLSPLRQQMIDATPLPLAVARWVIRHEWPRRLSDLVERRLMLLYHQRLTQIGLRQLAELLVAEGLLPNEQVDEEVAECVSRLSEHFGRRIE